MHSTRLRSRWIPCSIALPLLAACGKERGEPKAAKAPAKVTVEAPAAPAPDTAGAGDPAAPADATPGTVRGTVRFVGTPPDRKPLAVGSAAGCNHAAGSPPLSESLIVNGDKIQGCIVSIAKGLPRNYEPPPVPETPMQFDQKGCIYSPHVSAVRAGQKLLFHNSDPASHNVHVFSKYEGFNKTQPAGGADVEYVLAKPEAPVKIACDIHPWMSSWVGVFDHPFHAVSAPDGSFEIAGIPPGSYELVCWHETLGKQEAKLDLPAGGSASVEFSFTK